MPTETVLHGAAIVAGCQACAEQAEVACRNNYAALGFNFTRIPFHRVQSMPDSLSTSLHLDPLCARCGSMLRFSCSEPETNKPGFVHKVYECVKCRSTQSFVIPMQ